MRKYFLLYVCLALHATFAFAQPLSLDRENLTNLWTVENGSLEKVADGSVLRWRINNGESSQLAINPQHALLRRLINFDLFEFEWRVSGGEVNELGLSALGQVAGPRRGRVHHWGLGVNTTEHGVWHQEVIDLSRPSWLPWNNPDGEGTDAFFRFTCMALGPDTTVEFRNLRLKRAAIVLKPDWEAPITWPVKTTNADDSVTYQITYEVLNNSNRRADIVARVLSSHLKFKVAFESDQVNGVAHGARAAFKLSATIGKNDIDATPELYAEDLKVSFALAGDEDSSWIWQGKLVSPLSAGLRSQLVVSPAELDSLRTHLRTGDANAKKVTSFDRVLSRADEFVNVRLDQIPGGYGGPLTKLPLVQDDVPDKSARPRTWQVGSVMPEIVDPKTGRREVGTPLANSVWKYYLGFGGATENLGNAYLLTGDEKYARKAIELLQVYSRQYAQLPLRDTNDVPWSAGPNTLSSSRTSTSSTYGGNWNFKWIFKMLAAIGESRSWKEADKALIYKGFILPYATESMKAPGGISNMSDIASHNELLAGLLFDDATMVRWATMRDVGLIKRLSDTDNDGFSSEGRPVSYHYAAMAEYLPALVSLANSGLRVPGFNKEKILKAFRMPYERATLSGRVPITGDMARGYVVGKNQLADYLIALFPEQRWLLPLGSASTLSAQARILETGASDNKTAVGASATAVLLSTAPKLYADAGFAILRSGNTPETQIMATLDWGRSVMHASFDRNQITLSAFGKTFTHGPGSLYNIGSGGFTRGTDPRLEAFIGYNTLAQNLVTVDGKDQLRAVGKLVKWSDHVDKQIAVARVDGIAPGVSHTRGLMLTHGIVIMWDRLESEQEHIYDWTYHNFGDLEPGTGWTRRAMQEPLGTSNVYRNIASLSRLESKLPNATLNARWDLSNQVNALRKETPAPTHLNFWHHAHGGEYFSGVTGLNNPNTMIMPDAAPTIFTRVKGKNAQFWTVLEPSKGSSALQDVAFSDAGITLKLVDGKSIQIRSGEFTEK